MSFVFRAESLSGSSSGGIRPNVVRVCRVKGSRCGHRIHHYRALSRRMHGARRNSPDVSCGQYSVPDLVKSLRCDRFVLDSRGRRGTWGRRVGGVGGGRGGCRGRYGLRGNRAIRGHETRTASGQGGPEEGGTGSATDGRAGARAPAGASRGRVGAPASGTRSGRKAPGSRAGKETRANRPRQLCATRKPLSKIQDERMVGFRLCQRERPVRL